jgi:hypothetical protein
VYSALTSPIISLRVDDLRKSEYKEYYLHTALVAHESDILETMITTDMQERKQKQITLQEDADLFRYFVTYLYYCKNKFWRFYFKVNEQDFLSQFYVPVYNRTQNCSMFEDPYISKTSKEHAGMGDDQALIILARLYALGDRLLAGRFKETILFEFTPNLSRVNPSMEVTCELLRIVVMELPSIVKDEPLREHILWYASTRLEQLRIKEEFTALITSHPELAIWFLNRAGNYTGSAPKHSVPGKSPLRYLEEAAE